MNKGKDNMKKIVSVLLCISLLVSITLSTEASPALAEETIQYLDDGSYFETIIIVESSNNAPSLRSTTSTCSGSKTITYKSNSGTSLWSVTVNGSFSYVKGKSSKCTRSSVTTKVYSSSWKLSNKTSSKISNKAKAAATGTQYKGLTPIGSIRKNVTLTCSINGKLS